MSEVHVFAVAFITSLSSLLILTGKIPSFQDITPYCHFTMSTITCLEQGTDVLSYLAEPDLSSLGTDDKAAMIPDGMFFESNVDHKSYKYLSMAPANIVCEKPIEKPKACCQILPIQSSRKFTLFPKLPVEIQLQIWEACVDQIEPKILCFNWHDQFRNRGWKGQLGPDLLRVCVNSRAATLRRYQWFEETRDDGTVKNGYFINLKSDIVFFDRSMHLLTYPPHMIEEELGKVPSWFRYVERFGTATMLPGNDPHGMSWAQFPSFWHRMRAVFPHLKLINLVFNSIAPEFERLVWRWKLKVGQKKTISDIQSDLQQAQEENRQLSTLAVRFMEYDYDEYSY